MARLAIGVEYVLDRILKAPTDPAALAKHGAEVRAKLKQKGVSLPDHFVALLKNMSEVGAQDVNGKASEAAKRRREA